MTVVPRAGAWIETRWHALGDAARPVVPRAGAWIETEIIAGSAVPATRRPSRGGVD